MILKYVNSRGEEIDFISPGIRLKTAPFSVYQWSPVVKEQQYGEIITSFKKEASDYECQILFKGSVAQRKEKLNLFYSIVEYDIVTLNAGRLYHGNEYMSCFIIASQNEPLEGNTAAQKDVTIHTPYPFWIRETSKSFFPSEITNYNGQSFLDYPYDYGFDYAALAAGRATWNVDHFAPCKFKLLIYGPAVNPRIIINDNIYEVFVTLASSEYLVIDTFTNGKNSIEKFNSNGTTENCFNLRNKEESVFTPIVPENINISWLGTFGFDLTLFLERSEPLWS